MASPQEVQAMQQQLQALQKQTTALNEGLRRASQAHEMTQRRLTETETQLAAARAAQNRASKPGEESHTPQQCAQTTNIQWKERRVGKVQTHFHSMVKHSLMASDPELLEKYGAAKDPIDEVAFTEEEDRLAKAMYTFLMQYCPELTMNVIGQGLHRCEWI